MHAYCQQKSSIHPSNKSIDGAPLILGNSYRFTTVELAVKHIGDLLVAIAILTRVLSYVRGLKPAKVSEGLWAKGHLTSNGWNLLATVVSLAIVVTSGIMVSSQ